MKRYRVAIAAHSTSRPMIERHFPELDEEDEERQVSDADATVTPVVDESSATEAIQEEQKIPKKKKKRGRKFKVVKSKKVKENTSTTGEEFQYATPVVDDASGTDTVQEEMIPKKKKKTGKVKVVKSKKVNADPSTTGESSIEEVTPQSRVSKVKARVDVESEPEETPRVKASKVSVSKLNVKVPGTRGQPSRQSLTQEEHPPKVKAKVKKHVSISEAAPTYATDIVDESEGSSPPRRSAKDIARKLTKHYVLKSTSAEAKPKKMYVSDLTYAGRPTGKATQNSTHMRIPRVGRPVSVPSLSNWACNYKGCKCFYNSEKGLKVHQKTKKHFVPVLEVFDCEACPRVFQSKRGLTLHRRACRIVKQYEDINFFEESKIVKSKKPKNVVTENVDNGNDAKKVKKGKKKRSSKSNSDQPNDVGTSEIAPKASASTTGVSASEPVVSAKASQTLSKSMVLDKNKKKKINRLMKRLFRVVVDMRGFKDDEVTWEWNGRRMTVCGCHKKRRVVEVVSIPVGVNLERLTWFRRIDGFVVIKNMNVD